MTKSSCLLVSCIGCTVLAVCITREGLNTNRWHAGDCKCLKEVPIEPDLC